MTTTANFEIEHVDPSQSGKETTINAAWTRIDDRLAELLVHNMASDADYVINTGAAEHQNLLIRITDTGALLSTKRTIQFPANKGLYILHNLTAFDLDARVGGAGGAVTCGSATLNLIVSDGTDMLLGAGAGGAAAAGVPYDFTFFFSGIPPSASEAIRIPFTREITFPDGLPLSLGKAAVAATASTTFTFKRNGTSFGTANFAIAASTATFTMAGDEVFAAGDVFTVDTPTSDASLSNVGFALAGLRT